MTGKVITVAQHKGGAGKTTLSVQLAVSLHASGASVALIDVDPQGSSTQWHATRQARLGPENKIYSAAMQGWKLMREMPALVQKFDFVIIDSPPHADSEASIAVRMGDLVLIPIQPSPLDIWASGPTLQLVLQEKKPLMLVLNRVPPRARLNEIIMDRLDKMNIQVARQTLGNRVAFASSIIQGLGVVESEPSSMAADEIRKLAKEICKTKAIKASAKAA